MALALGVRPDEHVYIGDTKVGITQVFDPWKFEVKTADGHTDVVSHEDWVELMPEVWLSVGSKSSRKMLRLLIDAPRSVTILRDKVYERSQGND